MTSCSLRRIRELLRVRVTGEYHRPFYRSFEVTPSISLLSPLLVADELTPGPESLGSRRRALTATLIDALFGRPDAVETPRSEGDNGLDSPLLGSARRQSLPSVVDPIATQLADLLMDTQRRLVEILASRQ